MKGTTTEKGDTWWICRYRLLGFHGTEYAVDKSDQHRALTAFLKLRYYLESICQYCIGIVDRGFYHFLIDCIDILFFFALEYKFNFTHIVK